MVLKECRSSDCFPHAAFFCFSLIEVGHTLLGLEKVRLHSRELKSSQEERAEAEERKAKRAEKGVKHTQNKKVYRQCHVLFLLFVYGDI